MLIRRATAASFSIDKTMGINGGLGVCSVASSTRVHLHVPEPYNAVSGGTLSISASGRGSADPLITANAVTYDVGRDAESSGGLELNFTWALHDARALRLDAGGGLSRVTAHRCIASHTLSNSRTLNPNPETINPKPAALAPTRGS
jgi:hypothetical protein